MGDTVTISLCSQNRLPATSQSRCVRVGYNGSPFAFLLVVGEGNLFSEATD